LAYKVNREWYAKIPRGTMMKTSFAYTHRLKAFARFECFPEMLLFSKIVESPDWAVENALNYFCYRYPTFVIALYNKNDLWVKTHRAVKISFKKKFDSKEKAIASLRNYLNEKISERFEEDFTWDKKYYETFFESQFVEARQNPKLQRRMMPEFFVEKGTPEHKSLRGARFVKPNTNLWNFTSSNS